MKNTLIYFAAAFAALAFSSCTKETAKTESPAVKGAPATLSIGLPETRVSTEYSENLGSGAAGVKFSWEVGDEITVSLTSGSDTTTETFTATSVSDDGKTASFYNANSNFATADSWSARYEKSAGLSSQDGTVGNLPVYMYTSKTSTETTSAEILSTYAYLHFVLTSGTEAAFSHAYLRVTEGEGRLLGPDATDNVIKVTFDTPITVNSTAKDVWVAIASDDFTGSTLELDLMNADYDLANDNVYDNRLQKASVSWTPAKEYLSERVYRKEAALTYNAGIVGNTDCSSVWNTAYSDLFDIPAGEILHLKFINHSSKANNFNNWVAFVSNNVAIGGEGYYEYFVLRADNYGWGSNYATSHLASNFDWSVFKDAHDGATVDFTIENTAEGSCIFRSDVTSADGNYNFYETYHQGVNAGETIAAFLSCDGTYFEIQSAYYTSSEKTITKLQSNYSYYVYNDALSFATVGWPKDVVALYDDGTTAGVATGAVTFPGSGTLAASEGTQTYSVTYNGKAYDLDIPVVLGAGAFGSTTLTTVNWWDNWSAGWGVGTSLTKRFFVYSRGTENYNGPYAHISVADWSTGEAVFVWNGNCWNDAGRTAVDNVTKTFSDNYWTGDFDADQNHTLVTVTWTILGGGTTATLKYELVSATGLHRELTFSNIALTNGIAANCAIEHAYAVTLVD